MSVNLPPLHSGSESLVPAAPDGRAMMAYDPSMFAAPASAPAPTGSSFSVARLLAALKRYQWLIYLTTALGAIGGTVASRFVDPDYAVQATVFASPTQETGGGSQLSSQGALTRNAGWRDLFQSYEVIDPVMLKLRLYLRPNSAADSLLFASFSIDSVKNRAAPGDYTLKTENGRYTLSSSLQSETGIVGDSIGRTFGFAWTPSARLLGTKSREVKFKVMTPREASVDIKKRLLVTIQVASPVITIDLRGKANSRPAATLNAMLDRFIAVADTLKKRELLQESATLSSQLQAAQDKLTAAERNLEGYRVAVISKPSEGVVVVPTASAQPGTEGAVYQRDPVFGAYSSAKIEYESIKRDREVLEKMLRDLRGPNGQNVSIDAILSVPVVTKEPGSAALRSAVDEVDKYEASLRTLLLSATEAEPAVVTARRQIKEIREQNVPMQLANFVATLKQREGVLDTQLGSATRELQEIPQRTIRTGELQREQMVASDQYVSLRQAYARANLAQLSAVPDVKILDRAVMPLDPDSNTAVRIIGGAIFAGLALGLALAILLDRLDRRFRYPDQVKSELGLDVLGVVPVIDQSGRKQSPETVAQIVEAFRSIRMNVRYAASAGHGIALGITSPGPGDGKSLIASNLALSFAEGGWRTILVDADTRRGQLNTTFDCSNTPGLVEYLEGTSLMSEVMYPTRHDNLTLVPCGTRHRRAPELLATPRLQQFLAALSADYDVVIVDTPPLGAGTDAYAVGTACGQLALILRASKTDLKMAKAKLSVIDQLPVTMIGAILNEVQTDSAMYQYYSYDPDYVLAEEAPALESGEVGTAVTVQR